MAVNFKNIKLLLRTVAAEKKAENINAYLTWSRHVLNIEKQAEKPKTPLGALLTIELNEDEEKAAAILTFLALTKGAGEDKAERLKNGKEWLDTEIKLLAGLEQGKFNIRITTFTIQRESIKDLAKSVDYIAELKKQALENKNAKAVVVALTAIQEKVDGTFTLEAAIAELKQGGTYEKLEVADVTKLTDEQKATVATILENVGSAQTGETDTLGEAEALQAVLDYITTRTTNKSEAELRNIVRAMEEGDGAKDAIKESKAKAVVTALTAIHKSVWAGTFTLGDAIKELDPERTGDYVNLKSINTVTALTNKKKKRVYDILCNVAGAQTAQRHNINDLSEERALEVVLEHITAESSESGLTNVVLDIEKQTTVNAVIKAGKKAAREVVEEHKTTRLEIGDADNIATELKRIIQDVLGYNSEEEDPSDSQKTALKAIEELTDEQIRSGTIADEHSIRDFAKEHLGFTDKTIGGIADNDLKIAVQLLRDALKKGNGITPEETENKGLDWLYYRVTGGNTLKTVKGKAAVRAIVKDAEDAKLGTLDEDRAREQLQKKGAIGRFIQWIDGKLENRPVLKGILLALALVSVGVLIGGVFFLNFNTFGGASQLLGVTGFWTMATGLAMAAAMHFLPNEFYDKIPVINELHKFKQKYPLVVAGLKIAVGITAAVFFGIYINDFLALPTVFFEPVTALSRVIPIGFAAAAGLSSGVADTHKYFREKGQTGQQQKATQKEGNTKAFNRLKRQSTVRLQHYIGNDNTSKKKKKKKKSFTGREMLVYGAQEVNAIQGDEFGGEAKGCFSALWYPVKKTQNIVKAPFKKKSVTTPSDRTINEAQNHAL